MFLLFVEWISTMMGTKSYGEYWAEHTLLLFVLPMLYGALLGVALKSLMEADNESDSSWKHFVRLASSGIGCALIFAHFVFTVVPYETAAATVARNIHFVEPHRTPLIHVHGDVKAVDPTADASWTAPNTGDAATPFVWKPDDFDVVFVEAGSLPTDPTDGTIRVTIVVKREDAIAHGILVPKKRVKDDTTRGELWFQEKDKDGKKGRQSYVAPF